MFSDELEDWLKSPGKKTLGQLNDIFGEKTFAVALLLLLFLPALPIPTGGISHATELIAMLLSLEMIVGMESVWLPQSLLHKSLNNTTKDKALPFISKRIRWFEKYSKPRLAGLLANRLFRSFLGFCTLAFCLGAFFAPPFSGLDTLPAMGVVVLSLGIILEDIYVLAAGIGIGITGIAINIGLGSVIVQLFR